MIDNSPRPEDPPLHPEEAQEPPRAEPPAPSGHGWLWGTVLTAGFLLVKFKSILFAALGALKFMKFGTTALSMVLTIGVYAWVFGLPFAVGIVLLILVHEMGHYFVLRSYGLATAGPVFIPFIGAFISSEQPKDVIAESYSAIAGPVLGSLGALACLMLSWATGSVMLLALAYTGFVLNLFNLLPITPLDGGRVAGSISRHLWLVGGAILLYLIYLHPNPVLILIVILAAVQVWQNYQQPAEAAALYYQVPADLRMQITIAYFGLAILLWYASSTTHQQLEALMRPGSQ